MSKSKKQWVEFTKKWNGYKKGDQDAFKLPLASDIVRNQKVAKCIEPPAGEESVSVEDAISRAEAAEKRADLAEKKLKTALVAKEGTKNQDEEQ